MADPTFQDLLAPGEPIVAQLSGACADGTWAQLALTPQRLLVVKMRSTPKSERWEVLARLHGPRNAVRFTNFPRTTGIDARLALDGVGERIVFTQVDQAPLVQQVQAFLGAWGGTVVGGDTVATPEVDAYNAASAEEKNMVLYVVGGAGGLFLLCCGCTGVATLLRFAASMFLGY
ncbi:MAG: hypothetical protein ACOZNI_32955 [Myxococcota bacterium]